MKGKNTLLLNTATMKEIVQRWLMEIMPVNTPTVTDFKSSGDSYATTYEVTLETEVTVK